MKKTIFSLCLGLGISSVFPVLALDVKIHNNTTLSISVSCYKSSVTKICLKGSE